MDYAILACLIIGVLNSLSIFVLFLVLSMRHHYIVYQLTMTQQMIDVIFKKSYECEQMLYNMTKKDK